MLGQLQKFAQATSKQQITEIEEAFDNFYCSNPENAAREAIGIITNNELPGAARQLSATFLLAFVDRRWRVAADATNQNTRQLQQNIRGMLLDATINQSIQDKQTLRKFSLVVANVCRSDFPASWPGGPFEPILSHLKANNGENNSSTWLRHQMLYVMHQCIKEIVSNRTGRAQAGIQEARGHLLAFAGPLTGQCANLLLSNNDWGNELRVAEVETLSKIILTCAATLDLDVGSVMASLDLAIRFATIEPSTKVSINLAERFSQIVCAAVEKHGGKIPDEQTFVRIGNFLVKAMLQQFSDDMFTKCATALKCLLDLSEGDSKFSVRIRKALQEHVLTQQQVETLIRDLVSRFLRDTETGVEEWDNTDPEQFVLERDQSYDEDSPHLAAQNFFMALIAGREWPGIVDLVWTILTQALNSSDSTFVAAALHAIGLGYGDLGSPESFVNFLRDKLMPAMSSSSTPPIVLRRVVWVIGEWCDSLTEENVRRAVFESLADLLSTQPHPVVTLTCLRSIFHLCSDSSFEYPNITGRPLQIILNTIKAMLPRTRNPETTSNLVGLLYLVSSLVVQKCPEAGPFVKEIDAYNCVLDCLEGYIGRSQETEDADAYMCTAASNILEALASAFEANLLVENELRRAISLTLSCVDKNNTIHVWTEDEGWETIAIFVKRGVPPDVAEQVARAAADRIGNDFEGKKDVVKALAYLTVFCGPEQNHLFSPEIGDRALEIILDTDVDTAVLKFNAVLLLEGIVRRFPNEDWGSKISGVFTKLGDSQIEYGSAVDAVACAIILERHVAPISPELCSKFISKCLECADYLPNTYAKLILMQGLANQMLNLLKGTPFWQDASDEMDGLRETVKCSISDEEVQGHWDTSAVGFLLNERMSRV